MSDTLEQPTQQSIDYMVRVLQMNPVQKCEEIISARSTQLGQPNSSDQLKQAAVHAKADRQNVLAQLDRLRAEFWSLPQDSLEDGLAQLNAHGYADVAAAIARLRVVAAHRDKFPKLAEKLKTDRYIVDALKGILTKSPREALSLKEHETANFGGEGSRRRGRRFVKLVKRDMPAIYQLEADWFDSIRSQKAKGVFFVGARGVPVVAASGGKRNYWWIVGILVFGFIRGILTMSDTNHRGTNHYQPSYASPNHWQAPSWQPSHMPSSRPTQENDSGSGQRPGESQRIPTFGLDKDVWAPYQGSTQSEDRNPINPRSKQTIDELFAPQKIGPGGVNNQDDRYSR